MLKIDKTRGLSLAMPSFLIIGAAKSGTTSLYRYIKQHPEIYMSEKKEPHFFSFDGQDMDFRGPGDDHFNSTCVTDPEEYSELFKDASSANAIGEASPSYLWSRSAPERIKNYIPDVKLIAMLRQPVERAFSAYWHMYGSQREANDSFVDAFRDESRRIEERWMPLWYYREFGLYYQQLKRYYDLFHVDQIRVYLYEDFVADTAGVVQDMFRFVGVDEQFVPDVSLRYKVGGKPKNKALQSMLKNQSPIHRLMSLLLPDRLHHKMVQNLATGNLEKPKLDPQVRAELTDIYRDEILNLQKLINKDLASWLGN